MFNLFHRQQGAASVAIAMLLMFILAAAVTAVMNMSGSSVSDAAKNEEQVAALFVAESGVERARAIITAATKAGTLTGPTCTTLSEGTMPRGSFSYVAKAYAGTTTPIENSLCGTGTNAACTSCVIETTGTVGSSARTVRTVMSTAYSDGAAGCGDNFTLNVSVPATTAALGGIFYNVAWRARPDAGACSGGDSNNADLTLCGLNPSATSCTVSQGWKIYKTGTNNASSFGKFHSLPSPAAADYSLYIKMAGSGGSATRSYAATGVSMFPVSSIAVAYIGSYGTTGNTSSTSGLDGLTPSDWTCGADNATPDDMSKAAGADTLFYGLSALGVTAGSETTSVVYGMQPMYQISALTGSNTDFLYSQSWLSYNPAYWPSVTGATNGANFTGATGGVVTGEISGTDLNVTAVSSGAVRVGDRITGTGVDTTVTAFAAGPPAGAGGIGHYTISTSYPTLSSRTMTVTSKILRVTAVASGVLTPGDTISSGITELPNVLSFEASGTTGKGLVGEYVLSAQVSPVNSTSMQSSGKTITVPGGVKAPSVGTALYVPSGTGAFASTSIVGGIAGSTLTLGTGSATPAIGDTLYGSSVRPGTRITGVSGTVYTVTPTYTAEQEVTASSILARTAVDSGIAKIDGGISISGTTLTISSSATITGTLRVGDGIFGSGVLSNTRIMSQLTGTAGGVGTYTVCSLTGPYSSWTCVAHTTTVTPATITSAPSANFFIVSRQPTPRLSASAQLCGGICPFLFPFTGSGANNGTHFTITGLPSGRDWSSGFACLNNVDPYSIRYLARVVASQSSWSEPVR